jgi:hypothetical protein
MNEVEAFQSPVATLSKTASGDMNMGLSQHHEGVEKAISCNISHWGLYHWEDKSLI